MYIAICDDRSDELRAIEALLQDWQTEHRYTLRYRTFHSAEDLLCAARQESFGLYLLDIMMPGTDGLQAAREIRSFDDAAAIASSVPKTASLHCRSYCRCMWSRSETGNQKPSFKNKDRIHNHGSGPFQFL